MSNRIRLKKGIAILLAAVMCIPAAPVSADASQKQEEVGAASMTSCADDHAVTFHTGIYSCSVVEKEELDDMKEDFLKEYGAPYTELDRYMENQAAQMEAEVLDGYDTYKKNGSYCIEVETDAFFPYEVQFTYDGRTESRWFMTSDDTVTVGGHKFYLHAPETGNVLTRMSLDVGGDTVVVYPKEKDFTDGADGSASVRSLLPLEEQELTVDFSGKTPLELTHVKVKEAFNGSEQLFVTSGSSIVTWRMNNGYNDYDYHISSENDVFDLSVQTWLGSAVWEMIVGEKDQLAADNVRYIVTATYTDSTGWLAPSVYTESGGARGMATVDETEYYDSMTASTPAESYIREEYVSRILDIWYTPASEGDVYVSLDVNSSVFSGTNDQIKVYEGECTEDTLSGATEITSQIWNKTDMQNAGEGYPVNLADYNVYITLAEYDENGSVTGCLPVRLNLIKDEEDVYISGFDGDYYGIKETESSGVEKRTYILYKEEPVNGTYTLRFSYLHNGSTDNQNEDLHAFAGGVYASIAEAEAAGASNVTSALFSSTYGSGGYGADYSNGVMFSIFVGADGAADQKKYYSYFAACNH